MAADTSTIDLNEARRLVVETARRRRLVFMAATSLFAAIILGLILAYGASLKAYKQRELALAAAAEARASALHAEEASLRAERDALALQRALPIKAIGPGLSISEAGWLIRDGKAVEQIAPGPITLATFAPTGNEFAIANEKGVFAGHWSGGSLAVTTIPVGRPVNSISFSPDGTRLVTTSPDGTIGLWNISDGAQIASLSIAQPATAAAFSPDGLLVATATSGGLVMTWDAQAHTMKTQFKIPDAVSSIAFSTDQKALLVGSSKFFYVFDLTDARPLNVFPR
jgi:hypothetical protein